MAAFKNNRIGVYGTKDRLFNRTVSYEKVSLTSHEVNVYKYLGVRTNASPAITDVQDSILMENRDRAYDPVPVLINAWQEFLPESQFDLSRFGILNPLGNTTQFRFHIDSFALDGLGRYMVTGDVIQVPFWTDNDGNKSFWEVTDIDRKAEFENFYVIVTATPINDSQETQEITDMNSNGSLMDNLMTDIDAEQEADFVEDGLDDTAIVVEDPSGTRPAYDPRPDEGEDFLDDPAAIKF